MKKIITICLIIATTFSSKAQIKFDNEQLTFIQDIFYNTNKQNIETYMTTKNYSFFNNFEGSGDVGDNFQFNELAFPQPSIIIASFTPKDILFSVGLIYTEDTEITNSSIEKKLEDDGFVFSQSSQRDYVGNDELQKVWTKKEGKIQFITSKTINNKRATVRIGKFD